MASRRRRFGLRKAAEPSQSSGKSPKKQPDKKQQQQPETEGHGGGDHHLLVLQKQLGNAAVQRILALKREEQIKGADANGPYDLHNDEDAPQKEKFLQDFPFARQLVAQINPHVEPKLIIEQLFNAFNLEEFEYTGQKNDPGKFLQGDLRGDSSTLVKAFMLILQHYFAITDAQIGAQLEPFLAPAARIIGKEEFFGNVDERSGWLFTDHFWIEFGGMKYDLLFHKKEVKEDTWAKLNWVGSAKAPNGGYFQGKDDPKLMIYINDLTTIEERYTLDPRKVAPNWADIIANVKV
jgi:hypothetical protein